MAEHPHIPAGYDVVETISESFRTTVYRTRDRQQDRPVILKCLTRAQPTSADIVHFRREFDIGTHLQGPDLIDIYSLEYVHSTLVLIEEDFGGQSLDKTLKHQRFDIDEFLVLAIHIAEAVGGLHEQDVIHRDINPSNIVWNRDSGELKIIDFGLSTRSTDLQTGGLLARTLGTLPYIAPEQTGRTRRPIDYRTDYYSLGATLYELLTGRRPFEQGTAGELIHAHLARQPVPVHDRRPFVPVVLSELIARLMAKSADERYQSAQGLVYDLQKCLRQYRNSKAIADFELGERDHRHSLCISQRVYGRDEELNRLYSALQQTRRGGRHLVVVEGVSGIGKSLLVEQLQAPALAADGWFVSSSAQPTPQQTPYNAISDAFGQLLTQLLGGSRRQLRSWRTKLRTALGDDASLLNSVVPELQLLLGDISDAPVTDAAEAQHRFHNAFSRLVGLFATASTPLVVVLDDLHWLDGASAQLLEQLLTDDDLEYLLVVGTRRVAPSSEQPDSENLIGRLQHRPVSVDTIRLEALSDRAISEIVADSLSTTVDHIRPLAELTSAKTSNSPYFTVQFLRNLIERNLLWFDADASHWRWDPAGIAELPVTDNVVDLLHSRLETLSDRTRQLLIDATFIGHTFDIDTLAEITDTPPSEIYHSLVPALENDIVLAASDLELSDPDDLDSPTYFPRLVFSHDRIREATARLLDPDESTRAQLRVGRRLAALLDESEDDRLLFAAVHNLNAAIELIDSHPEQLQVLRLNQRAAHRAFEQKAIAEAARTLSPASRAIDDDIWTHAPDVATDIMHMSAESALLLGDYETTGEHIARTLPHLDDPLEAAPFYCLSIRQLTLNAELAEATRVAQRALRELGYELPLSNLDAPLEEAFESIATQLETQSIDDIAHLPCKPDRRAEAAMKILGVLHPAAGLVQWELLQLVGLKATALTLDIGIRPDSVVALAMYGAVLCSRAQPHAGYRVGRIAIRLARRFDRKSILTHTVYVVATMIVPWSRPIKQSLELLDEGYRAGLQSGNHLFAGYSLFMKALHQFHMGRDLHVILRSSTHSLDVNRALHNTTGVDLSIALRMIAQNLVGLTDGVDTFASDDASSAPAFIKHCQHHNTTAAIAIFEIARAQIEYLYGNSTDAAERLLRTGKELDPLLGTFEHARHVFWLALALIDIAMTDDGNDSGGNRRQHIDELRRKLAGYADDTPSNFQTRLQLVDAEIARLDGDLEAAINGYDIALSSARSEDLLHLEALVNERAGRFWLDEDKPDFAFLYLRDALDLYELWKAHPKAQQLSDEFGVHVLRHRPHNTTASSSSSADAIDLDSILQASEVIASHLEFDELLPALMEVTLENAGAARGTFIVADDDDLSVAVQGDAETEPVLFAPPTPLDEWDDGPRSIVRYVHRTGEELVLQRAYRDERFQHDPYLRDHRVRSVFCIPTDIRGQLQGLLYVENNLVPDAFDPERVRILSILASHIGLALNKARLYSRLREKSRRFRQLAENIREVFWLMEYPSRDITYLSPAYEPIWGRPMPSLPISIDEWSQNIVADERAAVEESLRDDVASGEYDITYRIQRPSGSLRWIHARGFPITDSNGVIHRIAGIARDITREREVARMKDEFISVVSHELRTPLTPITGIFSMLSRDYRDELPEDVNKMTELGLRNSRRLLSLIDDLLDIQKLSMDKVDFNYEIFDIRDIVEEAVSLNTPLGEARNIHFKLDPSDVPLTICGDRNRLIQVLTNLMSNAVKFSQPDDVVTIKIRRTAENARISVIDHGPGIPVEVRDKIFEKFTQADATLTRQHGGIGLGLAIARSLVDRLGGRIYFETELDQGTTFHVELPLTTQPRGTPPKRLR